MKSYNYRSLIFKKGWRWFTEPADVSGLDMVDIFSYEDKNLDGFRKKVGLTTVVKLDKSLDDIWSGFRKKFIAEQIKKGERLGIKVVFDKNFDKFFKIYQEFRKNKGLPEESHSLLQREGTLVSAYYGGKMIAGGVFLADEKYIRAWVLASKRLSNEEKKLREITGWANRMIIWEVVKFAKKRNMAWVDLGGLDSHPEEDSLSVFKEAFGGERVNTYFYHKAYSLLLKVWIKVRGYIHK